jgi:nicotinamide-nucleotide amidase
MIIGNQSARLISLAAELGATLLARHWRVATAESCTGGGVAAAITAIAGSSSWFEYGVVTYANAAKTKLLHVDTQILATEGAVSEAVVNQMVDGVLSLSGADAAVAISGIAGPSGGSRDKPVGTVWFAWGLASGERTSICHHLNGDRQDIQRQAVVLAIEGLLEIIAGN